MTHVKIVCKMPPVKGSNVQVLINADDEKPNNGE
jgi:hypothetical protein